MKGSFRVRISTALLGTALVLLPLGANWIRPPNPEEPELLHKALGWLYRDSSVELLICAFLVAFVSAIWFCIRRQWRSAGQCLLEMAMCVGAAILIGWQRYV
jgi:hypothetical protein